MRSSITGNECLVCHRKATASEYAWAIVGCRLDRWLSESLTATLKIVFRQWFSILSWLSASDCKTCSEFSASSVRVKHVNGHSVGAGSPIFPDLLFHPPPSSGVRPLSYAAIADLVVKKNGEHPSKMAVFVAVRGFRAQKQKGDVKQDGQKPPGTKTRSA